MKLLKHFTILVLVVLIAACSGNKNEDSDERKSEVKVPPAASAGRQSQQQTGAAMQGDAKPGYVSKMERGQKRRESIEDTFDDQGNLIERKDKMFDKYGNINKKNRYTYKYDDGGRRIEQWYFATTALDEPIMSSVNYITYNERGWKTENVFISYDGDGNEIRWAKNVYQHNAGGNVTEDLTENKAGIPLSKTIYNYKDGMLVSERFVDYDDKGNPVGKKTLKYNEYGKVIETINE